MTLADADHYRQLFDDLPVGWVVHQDGLVRDANPALERLFRTAVPRDFLGTALIDWVHPVSRASVLTRLEELHRTGRPVPAAPERMIPADGSELWVETVASLTSLDGRPAVQVLCWDVTERVRQAERLTRAALHDRLTGLPNRTHLEQRWDALLAELDPEDPLPAVLFLDLDGFKAVNDTHGHAAGDQVLVALAGRLGAAVREGEVVGRLSGDEFVVLLDRRRVPDPGLLVGRLEEVVGEPVDVAGSRVRVGLSAGVGVASSRDEPFDPVLRRADTQMYLAKATVSDRRRGSG